uniref:Uncharacterized protein n=1 Tax=Timema cristinae TaxID=61476 RepID=A0A7R9CI73_TIMCR|nr:unnamed protein product [Timema cristinae]
MESEYEAVSKDAEVEEDLPLLIKVYPRRWGILAVFFSFSVVNSFQWIQYGIIADVVARHYQIPLALVDWTRMVFMACYIVLILPACYALDKMTLPKGHHKEELFQDYLLDEEHTPGREGETLVPEKSPRGLDLSHDECHLSYVARTNGSQPGECAPLGVTGIVQSMVSGVGHARGPHMYLSMRARTVQDHPLLTAV